MKVIVATDGTLDPAKAASMVAAIAGADGAAIVLTVIEIPRQLLDALRTVSTPDERSNAGVDFGGKAPDSAPRPGWVGDDAIIDRYIDDQRAMRTDAMALAIREAGVGNVSTMVHDSENVVKEILATVVAESADVLCIGTHGLGRFEGLMGSISTKLARRAPVPVMLLR